MGSQLVGQKAPNFTLMSTTEEAVSLKDYDGKWKVLFFYAKDGSPTCKRGCLTFKQQYDLFQSLTPPVEIIGISQDSLEDHRRFKSELDLPFSLLSDSDREVADAYGVQVHLGYSLPSLHSSSGQTERFTIAMIGCSVRVVTLHEFLTLSVHFLQEEKLNELGRIIPRCWPF